MTITCGVCSPLLSKSKLSESGEPSKWGVRETGKFSNPSNTKEGFGHVTSLHFRNTPNTECASSLKFTQLQHPDPFFAAQKAAGEPPISGPKRLKAHSKRGIDDSALSALPYLHAS